MKRAKKVGTILVVLAALCLALIQNLALRDDRFDNVAAIAWDNGDCVVARYSEENILLQRLDAEGTVHAQAAVRASSGGADVSVADIALDSAGRVYLLADEFDAVTGEWTGQTLEIYDLSRMVFKRVQRYSLANEEHIRYRWLSASATALNVTGTKTTDETAMVRQVYELDTLASGTLAARASRSYQLSAADGVYQALPAGSDMAYISASGKLFLAVEDKTAKEVYPARDLTSVMYPVWAAPIDTETIYIGEQESGDMLVLSLSTGETTLLKDGTEPFAGTGSYAPVDVVKMAMADDQNFAAVVESSELGRFDLLLCRAGTVSIVSEARASAAGLLWQVVKGFALWGLGLWLALRIVLAAVGVVARGRTLQRKLLGAVLPLVAAALVLFGVFSYSVYAASVERSFEKQVVDEGNMLTALFGTESFDEIEYPYDYTGSAYRYLDTQMRTRENYTRAAYYERGALFTGVDRSAPCFYPFGIYGDGATAQLYRQAAYTGEAQTGRVRDAHGDRLICVTPIGGQSGSAVYLLETSVPVGSMTQYTQAYLRSYILVAALFLAALGGVLVLVFHRVLGTLGRIRRGLEQFAQGDRDVRLEDDATDELSDIIRVFNKMAGDIDVQLYTLRQTSENYYRFIPQQVFGLLGGESLGELTLGSGVEGEYILVCVSLEMDTDRMEPQDAERLVNRFFSVLSRVCTQNGAVLLTDAISLRSLKILCPQGADSAADLALSALSQVDGINASIPVQERLEPLFIVHRCTARYVICGEPERLVPTLICPDADYLTRMQDAVRGLSSRLVVTQAACEKMDAAHYFHRFIGWPDEHGGTEERFGLYDFYDCTVPEETRLINETRATFDKAMQLYGEKRWYDAKNLFAVVLRENQYDNVARYYIFSCEQRLRK